MISKKAHCLILNQDVLQRISDHLEDKSDTCSLLRASKRIRAASLESLYRCIHVLDHLGTLPSARDAERRDTLQQRLVDNYHLRRLVRALSMTLTPDATKILELCPRLESLRWRIINTRNHYLGPRQAVLIDLLPVPCTVTHLDLMQDILTRVSPGSIQTALSNAPGLNKMTLHTLYETAEQALRTIGSQIKALNLCIWGQQQSKMPASRLNSLFALVPNLTSLRLFTLSYDQLAEALFPPKVERLTFDTLHFHAVEKIMDLLATEPTWCPHLSNLPQFTSITSIDVLHGTVSGRGRLQAFS